MNNLPIFQTSDAPFSMMQTRWSALLNPLLSNPSLQSITLPNIALINGTTQVNHMLGRKLQGWKIVRQRAAASIYDAQDGNIMPALTLTLISSAAVVVDIEVF